MAATGPDPGRVVRDARKAAGMTQETLAEAIGCSKPLLSLMEAGRRTISMHWARRMEEALGLDDGRVVKAIQWQAAPDEWRQSIADARDLAARLRVALAGERPMDELREIVEQSAANVAAPLPVRARIPLINKVAAGYPAEFTDLDYPLNVADEYVECPDVTDPQAFAARVVGDSMAPDYREGEIVVFSPMLPTPSGSDCFVRLERDNETTFKRVYFEEAGARLRLQPINAKYPPRVVEREDVTGLWAAAYVMRKVANV